MTIDWTKPVETDEENPRPVRVLCTDGPDADYPVGAWVIGAYAPESFTLDGRNENSPAITLRNVGPKPVKREGWIPVTGQDDMRWTRTTAICGTREEAASRHGENTCTPVIAIARIEWEEVPE